MKNKLLCASFLVSLFYCFPVFGGCRDNWNITYDYTQCPCSLPKIQFDKKSISCGAPYCPSDKTCMPNGTCCKEPDREGKKCCKFGVSTSTGSCCEKDPDLCLNGLIIAEDGCAECCDYGANKDGSACCEICTDGTDGVDDNGCPICKTECRSFKFYGGEKTISLSPGNYHVSGNGCVSYWLNVSSTTKYCAYCAEVKIDGIPFQGASCSWGRYDNGGNINITTEGVVNITSSWQSCFGANSFSNWDDREESGTIITFCKTD